MIFHLIEQLWFLKTGNNPETNLKSDIHWMCETKMWQCRIASFLKNRSCKHDLLIKEKNLKSSVRLSSYLNLGWQSEWWLFPLQCFKSLFECWGMILAYINECNFFKSLGNLSRHHSICNLPLCAHPNADFDGLSLFEAQVQFRGCALRSFQFCELTFLFDPPLKIESRIIIIAKSI